MKYVKKLMVLTLAFAMFMAMSAAVFAVDHTVSTTSTTHTYEVYQIFTGTKSGDQLVNLKYGANAKTGTSGASVSKADMESLAAIEAKEKAGEYANDQARIADLSPFVDLATTPVATLGKNGDASADLAEGYYIIKDKDGTVTDPDTYTLYMFKVLDDNLVIDPKDGTTIVEKTVTETNDTAGTTTAEQKGADYDVGDSIPYSIDITFAKNVNEFKKYEVELSDTLSAGLTPPEQTDVTITFKDKNGTDIDTAVYGSPAVSIDGQKITVTYEFGNGQTAIGTSTCPLNEAVINVSYSAVLNDAARTGVEGNPNTYTLKYSNDPNNDTYNETPEKEVKVYTYELEIEKKDGNQEPLQGAGFTLYKVVTADYDGAQTGAAIKANLATGVDAAKLSDTGYYVPVTMNETATSSKVTHKTDKKIDAGDYVLIETTVPAGYNAYAGENITITSTIDAEGNLTGLTATPSTLSVSSDKALVSGSVINESGAELPETGGIGTVIFYVLGSILVIGSAIVLISRKRVQSK